MNGKQAAHLDVVSPHLNVIPSYHFLSHLCVFIPNLAWVSFYTTVQFCHHAGFSL